MEKVQFIEDESKVLKQFEGVVQHTTTSNLYSGNQGHIPFTQPKIAVVPC